MFTTIAGAGPFIAENTLNKVAVGDRNAGRRAERTPRNKCPR